MKAFPQLPFIGLFSGVSFHVFEGAGLSKGFITFTTFILLLHGILDTYMVHMCRQNMCFIRAASPET